MNPRKPLLIIMLVALGLAALGGAAGMLLGSEDETRIVIVIGVLTAVACLLLMAISRLYDTPNTRPAAHLLTAAVIVCLLLTSASIWIERDYPLSEMLGMTAMAVALTAVPGALFLRVVKSDGNAVAGWVGFCGLAVGLAILVAGNILDFMTPARWVYSYGEHMWQTGSVIAGAGVLIAGALAGWNRNRPWRWIGVMAAVAMGLIASNEIWSTFLNYDDFIMLTASVAAFVAYLNVALLLELRPGQAWLLAFAVGTMGLTLAVADVRAFVDSPRNVAEALDRIVGASSIISGCSMVAVLVVVLITRKTKDVAPPVEIKEISLTCPSCAAKQTLPIGESACSACGLKIFTRLEMPRCPKCEYSLLNNQSDRCPECGTELRPHSPPAAVPVG